ncbi:hypothetical protein OROGR_028906 [Orobanche gracilis]
MFGGSGKIGLGGGAAGKRNLNAPTINRAGRPSMCGGPRASSVIPSAAISSPSTSSMQVEESFALARENTLNFGMAIKLAPDLAEEIKRLEAQGVGARMKFDANPSNSNGNVIQVGDKIFRFTWSEDSGDLCDIYEGRQSGEDGDGLFVESGGTWRKLNVERELDESTKNHVKRRSEEAERKYKSRNVLFDTPEKFRRDTVINMMGEDPKTIVLDHQNPPMKSQVKAIAAAENNPWRNFKNRKEPPFKKARVEPPSGGPPKSAYKSGFSTTTLLKGKIPSSSPLSSRPDQVSPLGSGNLMKGRTNVIDVAPTQNMNNISNSDKEMHSRLPHSIIRDKSKNNRNTEAKPADLKSLVTSLLQEHQPRGMSFKALEKAIGDVMPNSARQIEPVLKQVAVFKAPGRYCLKAVEEKESFKEPPSQIGSSEEHPLSQSIFRHFPSILLHLVFSWCTSAFYWDSNVIFTFSFPETNCPHESPPPQKFDQLPAQDPNCIMTTLPNNDEGQVELNGTPLHTIDITEKIDILQNSPQQLSDKKFSDNSGGLAGSSSDSGSDSESDSSDSDSDSESHSRSKSQSPVRTSSDSESDASISSKQASDEDVDIMSDDDKESKHNLLDSVQSHPDDECIDIGTYEMQDDLHSTDIIEIEKDSPEDGRPGVNYLYPNNEGEEHVVEIRPSSTDHHESQERDRRACDGPENTVSVSISKGKFKKHHDGRHSDGRTHDRKRFKSKNLSQPVSGTISSLFGDSPDHSSPDHSSPDRPLQGPEKTPINVMGDRATSDGNNDSNVQMVINQVLSNRPVPDSQQKVQRSFEACVLTEAPSGEKWPDSLDRGAKYSERGFNAEAHREGGLVSERRPAKFSSEGVGDKRATMRESHHRKPETLGKVKEAGPHSNSHMGYSPKENNASTTDRLPVTNGRGSVLRREYSDLELGEFREPVQGVTPLPKKQFERENSFKQMETKPTDSDCRNSDPSKGRPPNSKITAYSGAKSSPKKSSENYADDLTKSHHKSTRPLDQYHLSCGDHMDTGSQHNKLSEMSSESRFADAGMGRARSLEVSGDIPRRMHVNSTEQQPDPVRGLEPHTTSGSKKQKNPNVVGESNGRRKDAFLACSNDGGQKKKEFSIDDNSLYGKYEKEEPELKGPVKDASQYKDYVKEYQEKYGSYYSLNKILESYRDEFSKLGKDLEAYKGRDMKRYHDTLKQMRSSFHQCGERHKRQKKIFLVLYEELKHLKQMIKDYAVLHK